MCYFKMAHITLLLVFFFVQSVFPFEHSECEKTKNQKLKVTVYYETGCPDCVGFFKNQFNQAWKIFLNIVEFELLPYGHAEKKFENDEWKFKCQHGANEMEGNAIHACAINKLTGKNLPYLYEFLVCCMENEDTPENAGKCIRKDNSIDYNEIIECSKSKEGGELLAAIGERSEKLDPEAVPTVVFNDVYNEQDDAAALEDLTKTICSKLEVADRPPACGSGQKLEPGHNNGIIEIDIYYD